MANIQDEDVNVEAQIEQPQEVHPNLEENQLNNQVAERTSKVSEYLIRIFIWTCMGMVVATNFFTTWAFNDVHKTRKCTSWLDWTNYLFTGTVSLLYLVGFYDYFLLATFCGKLPHKCEAPYLVKISLLAPVVDFLIMSDYFETQFDCRPSKSTGYIAYQIFTATSMILVVFVGLYILSTLYKIWITSQKLSSTRITKTNQFKAAYKDCLKTAGTLQGIEKFKSFVSEFTDLTTDLYEIRNLIWVYTLSFLRKNIQPSDFTKNTSVLLCAICKQGFKAFERVLPAEKEKELVLCHPDCLLAQLTTSKDMFMPLDRLSSLLDKVVRNSDAKFDLSLLKSI